MPANKDSCLLCANIPEDVLVLGCEHTLCLKCSAQNVQTIPSKGEHWILCSVCQEKTELEDDLYEELMRYLPPKKKVGSVHTPNYQKSKTPIR